MIGTLKWLWLRAKGYPPWLMGQPLKQCYLCGEENDFLFGFRRLVSIYGKAEKCRFDYGGDGFVWIWNSTETFLTDFASGEDDCVREICAKPGCFFDDGVTVTDVRTGEKVVIPPRPQWFVRDGYDILYWGFAGLRFVWFGIEWMMKSLWWKILCLYVLIRKLFMDNVA